MRENKEKERKLCFALNKTASLFLMVFAIGFMSMLPMNAAAQDLTIRIEQGTTLDQAFQKIIKSSHVQLVYNTDEASLIKCSLHFFEKKAISEILDVLLSNTPLTYTQKDGIYTVSRKKQSQQKVQPKERTITGIVLDEEGEPVIGAAVLIKGTLQGTATDINGRFEIPAVKLERPILSVSFLGKKTVEKAANANAQNTFTLYEDANLIDDVVIIGYGTKNRKSLTSSISSVGKEEIERLAPVSSNAQDLLGGGLLKGVLSTQNSGEPGAAVTINVRGITSPYPNMTTGAPSNAPLYVIDGVPLFIENTTLNPLLNLSPNDIESVDVLKDASATAIYGSRGANGVIIIKTKDGRDYNEKVSVEVGYNLSVGNPIKTFKPLNNLEFLSLQDEILRNTVSAINMGQTYYTEFDIMSLANLDYNIDGTLIYNGLNKNAFGKESIDWNKVVRNKNAITHQYNASVRGSSKQTNYSISLNGIDQEGLFKNDNLETYGGRISIDTKLSDQIRIGAVMNYSQTRRNSTSSEYGGESQVWKVRPDLPIYDEDGNYTQLEQLADYGEGIYGPNPAALLNNQTKTQSNQFLGNLYAEINLLTGLKFRTDFSMTNYKFTSSYFSPKVAQMDMSLWGIPYLSTLSDSNSTYQTYALNFRFDYSLHKGDHLFGAMVGYGSDRNKTKGGSIGYQGFPNDHSLNNPGSAQEVTYYSDYVGKGGLNSVYGRLSYDYAGRYLAEFSMRADESSKFGPKNRWGYFPALSLGWAINNEQFMENSTDVDQLKLRLSVGQTGSTNIQDFSYKQYYTSSRYGENLSVTLQDLLPNQGIRWEKTSEFNVGLDFAFFNNRLYGNIDWYYRYTDGALAPAPHIMESGMSTFYDNIIDMSNRGFEFSLGGDIIRTRDFTWSTLLNLSSNRNKIEKLNNAQLTSSMQDAFQVGYPAGTIKGYLVDHIIQEQEEIDIYNEKAIEKGYTSYQSLMTGAGDFLMKDTNHDGHITSDDRVVIANPDPNFFGGWNNAFTYKNITLSFLMQFSEGGEALYSTVQNDMSAGIANSVGREVFENTWAPWRRDAKYPRLVAGAYDYNIYNCDRYVFKTSYLRMKNIMLSYQLPAKLLKPFHATGASIYAVATNLFTISNWPGLDPELTGSGISWMGSNSDPYPLSKTFSVGVKLQF